MAKVSWNLRSYTKEQFIEAWLSSKSLREVMEKLNMNRKSGSQWNSLKSAAKDLGLTEDHMNVRLGHSSIKIPLDSILVVGSTYSSFNLKQRLWSEGLKIKKCENCGISEWMGQSAPLALDHINGINTDNRIENLRILCYNCHGQTDTYGRKKRN